MTIGQKARTALQARDTMDPRWLQLIMTMTLRTGLDPVQCQLNIINLSLLP